MRLYLTFLIFLGLVSSALSQDLTPEDIRSGGYVLYFRHAQADIGVDCKDPKVEKWWKSDDPKKTRQLTDYGQTQARVIGRGIESRGIKVDRVYCSEFRRTQDTANFMDLGKVRVDRELTPLVYVQDLESGILSRLSRAPRPGTVTVLVAHGHVLPWLEDLNEGDAAVFVPGDKPTRKGTIRYEAWKAPMNGLKIESRRAEDDYGLQDGLFTVRSSMGIGRVVLSPQDGSWPTLDRVRFEYIDGRGMPVLEGLEIRYGDQLLGRPKTEIENGARVWRVPTEALRDAEKLEIHWVDFYR